MASHGIPMLRALYSRASHSSLVDRPCARRCCRARLRAGAALLVYAMAVAYMASRAWGQTCHPASRSLPWAAQQQLAEYEQCLCDVPVYAQFYSRALGSAGACARRLPLAPGGEPTPRAGVLDLQHQHQQQQLEQPGPGSPAQSHGDGSCSATAAISCGAGPDALSTTPTTQAPTAAVASSSSVTKGVEAGSTSTSSNTSDDGAPQPDLAQIAGPRLIVRFRSYAPSHQLRATLAHELGPEGPSPPHGPGSGWAWVERRNPAAAHPTDFALIGVSPASRDAVVGRLEAAAAAGRLRDVHPDRPYKGKLAWVPEGQLKDLVLDLGSMAGASGGVAMGVGRGLAGEEEEQEQAGAADGEGAGEEGLFAVNPRPGRIMTRFSAEGLLGHPDPEAMLLEEGAVGELVVGGGGGGGEGGGEGGGGGVSGSRRRITGVGYGMTRGQHGGLRGQGSSEQDHDHRQYNQQQGARAGGMRQHRGMRRVAGAGAGAGGGSLLDEEEEEEEQVLAHLSRHSRAPEMGVGADGGVGAGAEGGAVDAREVSGRGAGAAAGAARRLHLNAHGGGTVPGMLQAEKIWKQGFSGKGIKVRVAADGNHAVKCACALSMGMRAFAGKSSLYRARGRGCGLLRAGCCDLC